MQVRVKLPSDPLIEFLAFCQAIAEAFCPSGKQGFQGIDCIIGKIKTCHVPIPDSAGVTFGPYYVPWQSVLVSDDGRTLNELLPSDQPVTVADGREELPLFESPSKLMGELTLPLPLKEADLEALAKVLPQLPPLHYPMSEEDAARFKEAYVNLPNRPMWMPDLVTEVTIHKRKAEQAVVLTRHERAMQQELDAERLVAVDASYDC